MEIFLSLNHGKMYRKPRGYTTLFFCFRKKTRRTKECQVLDVLIHSTIVKTKLLEYIFFKFPLLPSETQRRKVIRMCFMFPRILFYVTTILRKHVKKLSLRWKLLAGSVPSQNFPGKPLP